MSNVNLLIVVAIALVVVGGAVRCGSGSSASNAHKWYAGEV